MRNLTRLALAACAVALSSCGSTEGGYKLSASEAYDKLAAIDTAAADGPFDKLYNVAVERDPGKSVRWTTGGANVRYDCLATVVAIHETKSKVDLACTSDGVFPEKTAKVWKAKIADKVEAALRG